MRSVARRSPFAFFSRSLSRRLMGVGIGIVLIFLAIALGAPLLTQMGILADPTELLSNTPLAPPQLAPLVWDEYSRL